MRPPRVAAGPAVDDDDPYDLVIEFDSADAAGGGTSETPESRAAQKDFFDSTTPSLPVPWLPGEPRPDPGFSLARSAQHRGQDAVPELSEEALRIEEEEIRRRKRFGKLRDMGLPVFVANRILALLNDVNSTTQVRRLNRRVLKIAAFFLLLGAAMAGAGAAFFFKAANLNGKTTAERISTEAVPLSGGSVAAKIHSAGDVLERFLTSKDPASGLPLIYEAGRQLPDLQAYYGAGAPPETWQAEPEKGQLLQAGDRTVALIPVRHPRGHRRTVALIETPDGFRLDWRSLVTPERLAWADFLAQKPAEPHLYRATLTKTGSSDGFLRFDMAVPATDGKTKVSVPVWSRIADEVAAAADAGRETEFYVQFTGGPDNLLLITGLEPDFWAIP